MMKFLFLLLALFFAACSEYPDMEPDILAQHIYSQNPIMRKPFMKRQSSLSNRTESLHERILWSMSLPRIWMP